MRNGMMVLCAIVAAVAVGICIWMLWEMAIGGWPGLHQDAIMYLTPAVNIVHGRGDVFSVYATAYLAKENWRFDCHGQLYQFVLAVLTPNGDLPDFMHRIGLINCLSVAACCLYFFVTVRYIAEQCLRGLPRFVAICRCSGQHSALPAGPSGTTDSTHSLRNGAVAICRTPRSVSSARRRH